jgi:branched-chain amino acid transport system permease protein
MRTRLHMEWTEMLRLGGLGGIVALYLCLVGLVETFGERDIIGDVIGLGHALLIFTVLGIGYVVANRVTRGRVFERNANSVLRILVGAASAGLLTGGMVALLVLIAQNVNLRAVLINVSPELVDLLTFGQGTGQGILLLLLGGVVVGVIGGGIYLLPSEVRNAVLVGLVFVTTIGLLRDLLRVVLTGQDFLVPVADFLFASEGLTQAGAVTLFVLTGGITLAWSLKGQDVQEGIERLPPREQQMVRWTGIVLGIIFLLILPMILRTYLTNVIDRVGLFILMGLGLNIVVGFAGLLDLGYVAFFAIGAYVMALLTTTGELGIVQMSFWTALPIAVGVSVLAGILLGIPVLGMRGDYLAIVTLGFGEIIRVLAISNWLRPYIGGAQGILPIPRPSILGKELATFQNLYYLILVGCAIAFFIAWRLRDSRLGRAWMAMREDEDVAQAMGIDLVRTKLLAFATGAALAGTGGAIFASQVSSIYPHSFNLLISINVLSLIIVGGIGSLPGVVVGSLFLVGLPEVLSELEEYRLLFYGAALVVMMLARPEGLWPEATRQRELHAAGEAEPAPLQEPIRPERQVGSESVDEIGEVGVGR